MYDLSKKSEGGEVDELSLTEKDINYFASVRSFTVLLWMLSNMIVVALITETCGLYQFTNDMDNGEIIPHYRSSVYLTVILWIVAFMAMFRFLGCMAYLCDKMLDWFRFRHYMEDQLRQRPDAFGESMPEKPKEDV
ncbi:unnamed protein product [Ambrosiozyma monospora]|uniref:Unnamed protein product n=1 Tax=Ambrosiozyma monospora TaxID=43982 RepID=A0ACB5TR66_AMBMO|nr:unnamed protein product [Ambrosiozyma monospora]